MLGSLCFKMDMETEKMKEQEKSWRPSEGYVSDSNVFLDFVFRNF